MQVATKDQKLAIRRNSGFKEDIKSEWVQWVKQDVSKTSLNDLTFEEANTILVQQGDKPHKGENWAWFDKNNGKHKKVLSLLHEAGLTVQSKGQKVADTDWLSNFLKSAKSPVKKPLKEMANFELEKLIKSLENIVKSRWK